MNIKDLENRFSKVEKSLKKETWFSKEKWLISQHPFPKKDPDGITLHVFKKSWFNEDHLGIHFESYLDLDPKKQKKSYVTLHLLHHDEIPGLKISRKKLSQPVVDSIIDQVSTWEGYNFRAGKYGLQPFTKILDASDPNFETNLAQEFTRLCRSVGPAVDRVVASLTK